MLCRHCVHNLLLFGPEAGTSRPVRRLATTLSAMRRAAALETTRLHSLAGLTSGRPAVGTTRPFRVPPHTSFDVGVSGGDQRPLPGER
jgi:magnesium chelatase family protein